MAGGGSARGRIPCAAPLPCLHGVRHVLIWVCFQPVAHDSSAGPVCRERHILRAPRLLSLARTANAPQSQPSADSPVHTQVNNAAFPCEHPPPVCLLGAHFQRAPVALNLLSSSHARADKCSEEGGLHEFFECDAAVRFGLRPCLHVLGCSPTTRDLPCLCLHDRCTGGAHVWRTRRAGRGRWTEEAEMMEPDAPCRRTFSRMTANTIQLEVPVRPDGYSDLIKLAMPQARTCAVLLGRIVLPSRAAAVRHVRARVFNTRTAARTPACAQRPGSPASSLRKRDSENLL